MAFELSDEAKKTTALGMTSAVLRLRKRSPVRAIAERFLAEGGSAITDIAPLVYVLEHPRRRNWRERLVAAWILGHEDLPEEHRLGAITALFYTLTESKLSMATGARAWAHSFKLSYITVLGFTLLFIFTAGPLAPGVEWRWGYGLAERSMIAIMMLIIVPIVLTLPLGMLAAPFLVPPALSADDSVRAMAADGLGRLRYARTAGALAEAARDSNTNVQWAARKALREVVAELKPEHYGRAGPGTVENLIGLLHNYDTELILLALDGLEKVGGGSALRDVDRVARKGRREVCGRAVDVRAVLEERVRQERDPHRLLRPATAPDLPEEILLRPAGQSNTESERLLRSSHQLSVISDQ